MTGWLSWALNVAPQARPYITPLYHKIRGKVNSDGGVPINKDVKEALTQVAVLIAQGPALDLASPSLTRWCLANADLVIYTDACLRNADDTGAGLSFWFATAGGARQHFYCRPQCTYLRIQFAESLTIIRALDIATDPNRGYGPFRRVLVRTDSAPAVYALDSGAAHDTDFTPLRTLTLAAYEIASTRNFDLKVTHVAGEHNTIANDLSRLATSALRARFGTHLYSFDPTVPSLVGVPL